MQRLPKFAAAVCLLVAALLTGPAARAETGEAALWAALHTPGHFIVMRHALAPGVGDPAQFTLGDCGTQRNLSEAGRGQARRTGEAMRAAGITRATVFSSQWCRCLETARLLGLGDVTAMPSLNSFFGRSSQSPEQIRRLREDIAAMDLTKPVILVTHQVVVSALAGESTASGEMVVMRRTADNSLAVVGALPARGVD